VLGCAARSGKPACASHMIAPLGHGARSQALLLTCSDTSRAYVAPHPQSMCAIVYFSSDIFVFSLLLSCVICNGPTPLATRRKTVCQDRNTEAPSYTCSCSAT